MSVPHKSNGPRGTGKGPDEGRPPSDLPGTPHRSSIITEKQSVQVVDVESDVQHPPDGGRVAWLTVVGGVLMQFVAGYINAFGVYQDFFVRDFLSNFSSSQISWIGSIGTMILMATGIISGRLFDRGYFYHLYITGSVLILTGIFTLSVSHAQQYYQVMLSLGLAYGIGSGVLYVPGISIVSQHFTTKRALAMGIVTSGSSLGSIVYPILLNNFFHRSGGFADGVRASGYIMTGCLIVGLLLMRTRPTSVQVRRRSVLESAKKFIKDDVYVLGVAATFFYIQGLFFPIFYIQLLSDEKGINPTFSFYSLTILSTGNFIGRFTGGAAANPFGVMNTVIFCSFSGFVLIVSMLGLNDIAGITIFCLLYGFFTGVYVTLLGPMWATMATDMSEIGERIGVAYVFTGIGSLIGTPITGALLTRHFIWWRPILYASLCSFIGTTLFSVSRMRMARRKGTNRV